MDYAKKTLKIRLISKKNLFYIQIFELMSIFASRKENNNYNEVA